MDSNRLSKTMQAALNAQMNKEPSGADLLILWMLGG